MPHFCTTCAADPIQSAIAGALWPRHVNALAPAVLANEWLLKRIPADVTHSLMADLHIRFRREPIGRITLVTADGQDGMCCARPSEQLLMAALPLLIL